MRTSGEDEDVDAFDTLHDHPSSDASLTRKSRPLIWSLQLLNLVRPASCFASRVRSCRNLKPQHTTGARDAESKIESSVGGGGSEAPEPKKLEAPSPQFDLKISEMQLRRGIHELATGRSLGVELASDLKHPHRNKKLEQCTHSLDKMDSYTE